MVSIIVAVANNSAIGGNNQLLWHISGDLKRFKQVTSGHAIVMGRKTYESIGKPLPNRQNIVITRNRELSLPGADVVDSFEAAKAAAQGDELFIIGGGEIYRETLPLANRIYLTRVWADYKADTFFPEIDMNIWKEVSREDVPAEGETPAYSFILLEKNISN
ncbi:dihydrofolate reductase [Williamwhitmania taraxaci]|uniref:dihydrofolate reductase n=1 Tax=Williamwhitmania taraxaci TaxID=1640674 RepID=UPI001BAF7611